MKKGPFDFASPRKYLKHYKKKIRVMHNAKLLKECYVTLYQINDKTDWTERYSLLHWYVPRYWNKTGWKDADPQMCTLVGYLTNRSERRHIRELAEKWNGCSVVQVARLYSDYIIVDGTHRALGVLDGKIKYPIYVIEYSGPIAARAFYIESGSLMMMRIEQLYKSQ